MRLPSVLEDTVMFKPVKANPIAIARLKEACAKIERDYRPLRLAANARKNDTLWGGRWRN